MRISGRAFKWRNVRANSIGFIVSWLAASPLRLGVAVAVLPGPAQPSRIALREQRLCLRSSQLPARVLKVVSALL